MKIYLSILFFFFTSLLAQNEDFSAIQFNPSGPNKVGYLYIGGHRTAITQGTLLHVQKSVEEFKKTKPIFVLLELDTPGGEVFAAQKISDLLKEIDSELKIPVVAYINNWAISAGALLAYSSRYITTVKDGVMGAAEPVSGSGEKTSEKINSAIRADFAGRAAFFDRNPLIAKAMVDQDLILVWRNGKVVELGEEKQIEETERVITRKGKLLTLGSEEMLLYQVANLVVPPGTPPKGLPLLFSAPFFNEIPQVELIKIDLEWRDQIIVFLSQPAVASLLLMGVILCFYMELSTPGFGAFGTIGLIALFFLVLPSIALQFVSWFEVLLLLIGVALLGVELFILPGFGVVGILGILAILGAFGLLLTPSLREAEFSFDPELWNAAADAAYNRLWWYALSLVISALVLVLLARYLVPKIQIFSPLIHRKELESGSGFEEDLEGNLQKWVGKNALAISPLTPCGKVRVESEVLDAISETGYIDKGARLKIVGYSANHLLVAGEEL